MVIYTLVSTFGHVSSGSSPHCERVPADWLGWDRDVKGTLALVTRRIHRPGIAPLGHGLSLRIGTAPDQ